MSSTEPTLVPPHPPRRIVWLVLVHVVLGLVGAAYFADSDKSLRSATFLGIVFSQTSLLGIWGGLGPNPWWQRVIGVVVGVGYLGLLFGFGISHPGRETFFIVFLATAFVATPLLVVRFFKVAVQLVPAPAAVVDRIQFSIRHLMILTFIVACLITIAKWVQPDVSFKVLLSAMTFGAVGVLPVWLILATRQPVLYSVGLIAVGTCAGYWFARTVDVGQEGIWVTVTATEAMAVAVSLLIIRSCGYRLMRLPPRRPRGAVV